MSGSFVPLGAGLLLILLIGWRLYVHQETQRRTQVLQRYESLFHNNTDAVASLDEAGGVQGVNAAFTRLTGWTESAIRNTAFVGYVVNEDRAAVLETLTAAWRGEPQTRETILRDRDGRLLEVKLTTVPIQMGHSVVGVYQIAQDIRLRKEIERKLETQALHDYLTGLPNRALFQDRLEHAIERARRPGYQVVLFYVDLDRFKAVNDGAGHIMGDELLKTVASRLGCFLRGGDTVARLGGDEFAVLTENVYSLEAAMEVAERITQLMIEPIPLANGDVQIGASVGVAISTAQLESPDELVRQADIAMYEAKRLGGHRYEVYRPELEKQAVPLQLEGDLRRAINDGELLVYYQPIIDLAGTRIVGVEALVRWKHPDFGLLEPADFVPLAEETGLIVPLDRQVLRTACREVMKLRGGSATNVDRMFLSVNYSQLHLEDEESIEVVARILAEENFKPERLQLEITETVVGNDRSQLKQLKALGVMLAIDDFGSGYSSLGYLKDVEVDNLKIDRSFIRSLGEEQSSSAIVRTILTLASVLNLGVIIEGIEEAVQLRQLQELGGRFVQGFYFAEPMDLAALQQVVRRGLPPEWLFKPEAKKADAAVRTLTG